MEKVIFLYGKSFEKLKNEMMQDNVFIAENRDLMYIEADGRTAHCVLFQDGELVDTYTTDSVGYFYVCCNYTLQDIFRLRDIC